MRSPRALLAAAAVAAVVLVDAVAIVVGTPDARLLLCFSSAVAVALTVHGVTSKPVSIGWGLVLGAPPVVALLTHGRPSWLIGPLAAVLLLAGELGSLSWELRGAMPDEVLVRHRLMNVVRLGMVAMAAAVAIGLVNLIPSPGGTAAVVVAALALAIVARITFDSRTP